MDWSRLASAASRFRRNRPQKSSSQARFSEVAMLLKNRLPGRGSPRPPPAATPLISGLVPVVVVPAGVNGVAPAMGVVGVDRGPTTVDGDRPVPNVAPGEGGTP